MNFDQSVLTKIVATYELPPIETPQDDVFGSLRFVIQVIQLPSTQYAARVLRKERVNVEPAYHDQQEGLVGKMTAELLVQDDSLEWERLISLTEEEALRKTLSQLNELVGNAK